MVKMGAKKVYVGLSGGVDSAVSAALLIREGYEVTGVFIRTWHPEFLPCTEEADRLEAARVAAHLDIPFLTLDFSDAYKRGVADELIEGYRRGETPNPDVLCNKEVKFGAFLRFAKETGADCIATGHYARIARDPEPRLLKGADLEKDQSYFLWMLGREELAHSLFPIGHLRKPEVRALARKWGLPNAERKDSQGICFLGDVSMPQFLSHYLKPAAGAVLSADGEVIGEHQGAALYTVGQRHGFKVHGGAAATPNYVVAKDIGKNTLTVTSKPASLSSVAATLRGWNAAREVEPGTYGARFRYRQELREATLAFTGGGPVVTFAHGALAPVGQSLVLYSGDELVGGGIVSSVS